MKPERARLIEKLYADALEREASERRSFLSEACGNDHELYQEIESLLAQGTRTGSFLESPAIDALRHDMRFTCSVCSVSISAGSRFCSSCGHSVDPLSVPTAEAPPTTPSAPVTQRTLFTPGTLLAGRYRIVAFLGRGGMGEVYRADDLTLGQAVALKFLPPALAANRVERERFLAEVRITRQLSHPNICRVYDIAKSDGRYFLSMEYIDGEDLSSLLKRIGYLPAEKALEISRQLLSGLSAAHERGVLHRDLKPSNIMLDGRGHVRIMDFGLATVESPENNVSPVAEVVGTPAYMAPEQFAGKPATVQSDIYALGIVLYEIYTGKRAFAAGSIAELQHRKETEIPKAPSEIRQGIPAATDKLIMRCVERSPLQRPTSVRIIAAAFGGEDPLLAALAAGETPSPELVAASGPKEGLRIRTAVALLLLFAVASVSALTLSNRTNLLVSLPVGKAPAVLIDQARQYIRQAGYSVEAADTASGLSHDDALMEYIRINDRSPNRWDRLNSQRGVTLWFRQSPHALERSALVSSSGFGVTPSDPLPQFSGELLVLVDMQGRLKSFKAIPESVKPASSSAIPIDWALMFSNAGLKITEWTPVAPKWNPDYYADTQAAWEGVLPEDPNTKIRIEAAAFGGKPIQFELIGPWTQPPRVPPVVVDTGLPILNRGVLVALLLVFLGALFFARRNLRMGRGDRRGANTLVVVNFVVMAASWALNEHHVNTAGELFLLLMAASVTTLFAVSLWVFYIALEPAVRRRWPSILVASSRLLGGRWRDPLVGREVLIGCVAAACNSFIQRLGLAFPAWLGRPGELPIERSVGYTFASGFSAFGLLDPINWAVSDVMSLLFLYLLMRTLLRREWLAVVAVLLLQAAPSALAAETLWIRVVAQLLSSGILLFVMRRVGIVAATTMIVVGNTFLMYPITLQVSAWYARVGFIALGWAVIIALFGFFVSIQGQKILDIEDSEKAA